jgi:c-di-GMP-binding flagellar brake protein YcgR
MKEDNLKELERRQFTRIKYPCRIKVYSGLHKGETFFSYTENISCGGVCAVLEKDLGLFVSVGLQIDLEDSLGWVECRGNTVWVARRSEWLEKRPRHFDTGIEFSGLKEKDRLRIEDVVQICLEKKKT